MLILSKTTSLMSPWVSVPLDSKTPRAKPRVPHSEPDEGDEAVRERAVMDVGLWSDAVVGSVDVDVFYRRVGARGDVNAVAVGLTPVTVDSHARDQHVGAIEVRRGPPVRVGQLDAGHRHVDRVGQRKHAGTCAPVAWDVEISVGIFVWTSTIDIVLGTTAYACEEQLLDLCVHHTLAHDGDVVRCVPPDNTTGVVVQVASHGSDGLVLRDPVRSVGAAAKRGGSCRCRAWRATSSKGHPR
jgi:hypothetical protein